jgi:hypothetical protein
VSSDQDQTLTPEQRSLLGHIFRIGLSDLQRRINRGDEDERLALMADTFEAYFALCRVKLGHDQVPIATWETYAMIKQRSTHRHLIDGSTLDERHLIDGRTPDECLAQYQLIQREEAPPDSLTRRQRFCAQALWSHDVRVAVRQGEACRS